MWNRQHRFAKLRFGGDLAAMSDACTACAMAHAIQPMSTNKTEPTATQAAAPGSSVSWNITHPMRPSTGW